MASDIPEPTSRGSGTGMLVYSGLGQHVPAKNAAKSRTSAAKSAAKTAKKTAKAAKKTTPTKANGTAKKAAAKKAPAKKAPPAAAAPPVVEQAEGEQQPLRDDVDRRDDVADAREHHQQPRRGQAGVGAGPHRTHHARHGTQPLEQARAIGARGAADGGREMDRAAGPSTHDHRGLLTLGRHRMRALPPVINDAGPQRIPQGRRVRPGSPGHRPAAPRTVPPRSRAHAGRTAGRCPASSGRGSP
mgnify:CR=1 FL=1